MSITTTTCHTVICDVCDAPLDGIDVEGAPIHWGCGGDARTYARDEGWTIAPYGKSITYGPKLIVGMAVCDAGDKDHQAARKLILTGDAS